MADDPLGEPYHAESHHTESRGGLGRLTAWGAAAAFSLAVVVLSANSGPGAQQRLAAILALTSDQAENGEAANTETARPTLPAGARPASRAADPESEGRRLSETLRTLAADRDRMLARISTLERNLDDAAATGSVDRDGTQSRKSDKSLGRDSEPSDRGGAPTVAPAPPNAAAAAPTVTNPDLSAADAEASTAPGVRALPAAAPSAAMAAAPPVAAPAPGPLAAPTTYIAAPAAAALPTVPPAAKPPTMSSSSVASGSSTPGFASGWLATAAAMPSRPFPAPPALTADPGAGQAVAGAIPAAAGGAMQAAPTRTEFGADIGGGPTVEGLRGLWASAKAVAAPLLDKLQPVFVVREIRPGALEYRLIVGPLASAGAAQRLCASLAATRRACRPTVFDGQRVAQLPTQ